MNCIAEHFHLENPWLENSRQFCDAEHFDDSFQLLFLSLVSLLMCPHQKEKLGGDNLSYYPTGTFLVYPLSSDSAFGI